MVLGKVKSAMRRDVLAMKHIDRMMRTTQHIGTSRNCRKKGRHAMNPRSLNINFLALDSTPTCTAFHSLRFHLPFDFTVPGRRYLQTQRF